jgi:hypothetical protein
MQTWKPEQRDLLDMLTDPALVDTFKKGAVARIPVARVGEKILSMLFDKNAVGEYEVTSEWSIYSANSNEPKERTVEGGHRFCVQARH